MADRKVSLLELCLARSLEVEDGKRLRSIRLASTVAAFVDEWARYMRSHDGAAPTMEEYWTWANVSPRTGYYRLAAFRRLFGEWHADPTALAGHVNRWVAEHKGRPGEVASIPRGVVPA